MQTLVRDLRNGVRMLLKRPGFTLIAAVTLALGIGASTAIFSAINSSRATQTFGNYRDWNQEMMLWTL